MNSSQNQGCGGGMSEGKGISEGRGNWNERSSVQQYLRMIGIYYQW